MLRAPLLRAGVALAVAAGALAASAGPAVAQQLVVADTSVVSIAAQGGVVAWTTTGPDGRWHLMVRTSGVVSDVVVPASRPGRLVDLAASRDDHGRVFLTYVRCTGTAARPSCAPRVFSFVTGERRAGGVPRARPCTWVSAWRAWRDTTAVSGYGNGCPRGRLVVRDRAGTRHLAVPRMLRPDRRLPPWRAERITLGDLRGDRFAAVLGVGTAGWVWVGSVSHPRDAAVYTRSGSEGDCAVADSAPQLAGRWVYWTESGTCTGGSSRLVRAPVRRDAACEGHREAGVLASQAVDLAVDGDTFYYSTGEGIRAVTAPTFGPVDCFNTAHVG